MKRLSCSLVALAFTMSAVAPAFAQSGQDAMMAAGERMQAAQAQAQADAVRPGDDALDCTALEAEMIALAQSPEMQTFSADAGDYAAQQQERVAQVRGQMAGQMGMGLAMGIASSFIPGLGMVQGMMMQAQMQAMQAQGNESQLEAAAQFDRMSLSMPMMMRAQRVNELAQAKECPFLQQQVAAPAQ